MVQSLQLQSQQSGGWWGAGWRFWGGRLIHFVLLKDPAKRANPGKIFTRYDLLNDTHPHVVRLRARKPVRYGLAASRRIPIPAYKYGARAN